MGFWGHRYLVAFSELGAYFKVSRERVRQIEGQALRKLRKGGLNDAVN